MYFMTTTDGINCSLNLSVNGFLAGIIFSKKKLGSKFTKWSFFSCQLPLMTDGLTGETGENAVLLVGMESKSACAIALYRIRPLPGRSV